MGGMSRRHPLIRGDAATITAIGGAAARATGIVTGFSSNPNTADSHACSSAAAPSSHHRQRRCNSPNPAPATG